GNSDGYELEKDSKRSEALVMLIRMIGKENEVLSNTYTHPFLDSGWEDKYIGYAYSEKIANGIGENIFGGEQIATEKQYCAFVLRALGYLDFDYENADILAKSILKTDENKKDDKDDKDFTRGDMAYLSYKALYAKMKDSDKTLADTLIANNVISLENFKIAEEKIKQHTEKKESVTIMVYMVASDLESMQGRATNDLNEMMTPTLNENVNVYLMTGGTSQWKNSIMSDGKTEFFKLDDKKLSLIEDLGDKKITEPDTLTDFVEKSVSMSPADRYVLVFWDHGKGTMGGFGKDELNQGASMSILNIKTALEKSQVKFDIIGFDACLMATAETATALENVCSFMIASEETTPACGWYYTTWLDAVSFNPSIDTLTFAKLIVDSAIVHGSLETNANCVLSVTDVKKSDDIYNKLKNVLNQESFQETAKAENDVKMLGEKEGGYDQFDLVDFFDGIEIQGKDELISTVKKTIVYNRLSAPFMKAFGLAFYYPKAHVEKYEEVRNMMKGMGYEEEYFKFYDNMRGNYNEK
ncbi:MAG: clostripain-related cysteine peptidase, partial [Oscillospiraceae bacterium]